MNTDQNKLEYYLKKISDEFERSNEKHGGFATPREGHSVIEEEYDEFWDAIKKDDAQGAEKEVIQLAAMALKYLYHFNAYDLHPDSTKSFPRNQE